MTTALPWALFGALVVGLVAIDLLSHRGGRGLSHTSALTWSAIWIGVALAFGAGVWAHFGAERGEEYLAAYLLEKSLSVDNLFVFLVVFERLRIPQEQQRRVLTWGILGALVLRGIFIALGSVVLERWHAVVYVLGALLVLTGIKTFRGSSDAAKEEKLLAWLRRHLPFAPRVDGARFFVRSEGRLLATPLLLALIVIELSDVAFAVDSVPAAFAITDHPFIVYSSNVFAVLGLRSLYVAMAAKLAKTRELEIALSAVLVFAGVKMLAAHVVTIPPFVSVAVIAGCIASALLVAWVKRIRKAAACSRRWSDAGERSR